MPSMAEPSKPRPSSNAASSSAGAIATDFSVPNTSVNHRRIKRTSRSSTVRSANSCCLSIVAYRSITVLRRALTSHCSSPASREISSTCPGPHVRHGSGPCRHGTMVVTMSEDHLTPSANPPVDVTSWTQATDPRDRSRAGIATRTKGAAGRTCHMEGQGGPA